MLANVTIRYKLGTIRRGNCFDSESGLIFLVRLGFVLILNFFYPGSPGVKSLTW